MILFLKFDKKEISSRADTKVFLIQLEKILKFFKILIKFLHWNLQVCYLCVINLQVCYLCVIARMSQRFANFSVLFLKLYQHFIRDFHRKNNAGLESK